MDDLLFLGSSPVRISFAGGGTDIPEFYEKYESGCVVTTTINHFTYVMLNTRHDNNFQIFSADFQSHNKPTTFENLTGKQGTELAVSVIKHLNYKKGANLMLSSDVPPRSGLGSSSSLTVNLVNVISKLTGKKLSKKELAETAHYVERTFLNWPMGKQDEYITAYGGFNFIEFNRDSVNVESIKLNNTSYNDLQNNLLLFFIGGRTDVSILPNQIEKIQSGNPKILESLSTVKKLAELMRDSLTNSDLTKFGELLHNGWIAKKQFTHGVSSEKIDQIYEIAIGAGAIGGKLTGAGGGGHMLLYCEQSKQANVISKMQKHGLKHIKFNFYTDGAKILNLYDYSERSD